MADIWLGAVVAGRQVRSKRRDGTLRGLAGWWLRSHRFTDHRSKFQVSLCSASNDTEALCFATFFDISTHSYPENTFNPYPPKIFGVKFSSREIGRFFSH